MPTFAPLNESLVIFPVSVSQAVETLDSATCIVSGALKLLSLSSSNLVTSLLSFRALFVNPNEDKNLPKSEFAKTVPVANPSTPASNELNSIPPAPAAIDIFLVSVIKSLVDAPAFFILTYMALYI